MADDTNKRTKEPEVRAPNSDTNDESSTVDQIIAKAGDIKSAMSAMQQEISDFRVEGSAADGLVTCSCDGAGRLREIKIDDSLMTGSSAVLEELIVTALGQARDAARDDASQRMGKMLGGLPIPASLAGMISQFVSLK